MTGRTRIVGGSEAWQRFEIRRIEDLANVILGADVDAIQMAGPRVQGSLAFAARPGVLFSSGLIEGNVALGGPLSADGITIGIGLRFGPNSRLWLRTVRDGDIGVVMPGERQDALLTSGSLYVAATLSTRHLEDEARRRGVALDHRVTSRTGLYPRRMDGRSLTSLARRIGRLHRQHVRACHGCLGSDMLNALIEHCADPRQPEPAEAAVTRDSGVAVVSRARRYIVDHLSSPLAIGSIATAAGTSRRSLSRAFVDLLNDTPAEYIRRLRLHRIRRDLTEPGNARIGIAAIAARWGLKPSGEMSLRYRELFGELPEITRRVARERARLVNQML